MKTKVIAFLNKKNIKYIRIASNIIMISLYAVFIFSCTLFYDKPSVISVSLADNSFIEDAELLKSIEVKFSKQMNCYTTEKGIHIEGYTGTTHYQWTENDSDVTLLLKDPLEVGKKYVLTIDSKCESSEGVNIESTHRVTFYTYSSDQRFTVVSHTPGHNDTLALTQLLGTVITLNFSNAVGNTAIKDKIALSPSVNYAYEFSEDRSSIILTCADKLMPSTIYKVKVSKTLFSSYCINLEEDYEFSFNTETNNTLFQISEIRMTKDSTAPIVFDIAYLAKNEGKSITKDMVLQIEFNTAVYLNSVESYLAFTPYAQFRLEYGSSDNTVNVFFKESLACETEYKVAIQKSLSSIYGKQLDRDYTFYFTTDGSVRPKIAKIIQGSEDPMIGFNTIYDASQTPVFILQNFNIKLEETGTETRIHFYITFYKSINVFESISAVTLVYVSGLAINKITKNDYNWDANTMTLKITFTIEPPTLAGTSTLKFTVNGEPSGIRDTEGNFLKDPVILYGKIAF